MAVSDWSTTPASNTSIDSINIGEGCSPGNVNNALRSIMAAVRSFYDSTPTTANTQPKDATLTALAGVTTAANKVIYATGSDTFTTTDFTATGRSIVGAASAAAALTAIGGQAALTTGTGGDGRYIGINIGGTTYYLMWGTKSGYYPQGGSYSITLPVTLTTASSVAASVTAANSTGGTGTGSDCWAQVKNVTTTALNFVIQDSSGAASATGVHFFAIGY